MGVISVRGRPLLGGGFCGTCDENEVCQYGQCGAPCDSMCISDLEQCVVSAMGSPVCVPVMVEVPAGAFWMGCNAALDGQCQVAEKPYHEVTLDSYRIDRTEVTNAQYTVFLNALQAAGTPNQCPYDETPQECYENGEGTMDLVYDGGTWSPVIGLESHPMVAVTWFGSRSFCLWAGKTLCTEAQWEKAARGGCEANGGAAFCEAQSRIFPWEDGAPACDLAVFSGCGGGDQPVCSYSPAGDSPYGACDMAGNVSEWMADWFGFDYYQISPPTNPQGPSSNPSSARCMRGGSATTLPQFLRVSFRNNDNDWDGSGNRGFRCCGLGSCADGVCDAAAGENCVTCPQDCGCQPDEVCFDGTCCAPDCDGKECGGDGCGNNTWVVTFSYAGVTTNVKDGSTYVRCVR